MRRITYGLVAIMMIAFFAGFALQRARSQEEAPPAGKEEAVSCKVGFVNLARVLEESQQGKKLKQQLDAERDKMMAPLKEKQKQLQELEKKITALTQEIIQKSSVWDDSTKLLKQNELQNYQLQYNQLINAMRLDRDELQQKFLKKKNEMLKPLEDKLNQVMEEIGKKGNYCVVFDVSPPAANLPSFNPIIYRDPARDITDQIIEAVDR